MALGPNYGQIGITAPLDSTPSSWDGCGLLLSNIRHLSRRGILNFALTISIDGLDDAWKNLTIPQLKALFEGPLVYTTRDETFVNAEQMAELFQSSTLRLFTILNYFPTLEGNEGQPFIVAEAFLAERL